MRRECRIIALPIGKIGVEAIGVGCSVRETGSDFRRGG